LFDIVIKELVYKERVCKKAKEYFKQTLNLFYKNKVSKKNNIWCLIRIGQGMSFYSQTKIFFGGDKSIADLLQAQVKNSCFLELQFVGFKMVLNLYSCFFKNYPNKYNSNLNKHIKILSSLLNVSQILVIQKLAPSEMIIGNNNLLVNFSNYYHYLKQVLENCKKNIYKIQSSLLIDVNFIKKYKLTYKRLEQSFAVAASLSNNYSTMHLLSAFGYLDKLLV